MCFLHFAGNFDYPFILAFPRLMEYHAVFENRVLPTRLVAPVQKPVIMIGHIPMTVFILEVFPPPIRASRFSG